MQACIRRIHFTWCLLLLIFFSPLLFHIHWADIAKKWLFAWRDVCWNHHANGGSGGGGEGVVEVKVVVVIANIDAINTEARSGTNTKQHHSKSWKCNDCNNICDTNVKSFWIVAPFRVSLRFLLSLAPPRKMPKRKSVHKKVKFIAMKKAKDDEENVEQEKTQK